MTFFGYGLNTHIKENFKENNPGCEIGQKKCHLQKLKISWEKKKSGHAFFNLTELVQPNLPLLLSPLCSR